MTKDLLNQFEDFELFAENVEKAVEAARIKTEYPVDLRLYMGDGQYDIFNAPASINDYNEIFQDAKKRLIETNEWQDETFIDFYENIPSANASNYCFVTVWLNYVDGRVLTRVEC
jgi:hypothetical protein